MWKFLWLFAPTWDAVKLTLKAGFICPFVVIEPTNLGAIIVVHHHHHHLLLQHIPDAEYLPFYRW